jgi:YVTN family beta-propeller protein
MTPNRYETCSFEERASPASRAGVRAHRAALVGAVLACVALACACAPATEERFVDEPYEGEAYPDKLAPLVWPSGPAALVTDSLSDTVSVVDLATGARTDVRPVGRNPVDLDGPHHITIDASRGEAFIALSYPVTTAKGPHAEHGSAVVPGFVQRLSLRDLRPLGQVRVESNPGDIVLSADGSRLVVSHFDLERALENPTDLEAARASLAVIDASSVVPSGSPRPTFVPTCVAPHGIALAGETGSTAFVACYGEDRLAVVDLDASPAQVELVDVGPGVSGFGAPIYGPYVATLAPDGATLLVSNTASRDVRFFDVASRSFDFERTIATEGAPYFPAFDASGRYLAIPTQAPDGLVVVDLEGSEPARSRSFAAEECDRPHAVIAEAGGWALVCEGDRKEPGAVLRLDASLATIARGLVGLYPDAIVSVPAAARGTR